MQFKPSEMHYSHDSIRCIFTFLHRGKKFGETLDELVHSKVRLDNIPMISVNFINGNWLTYDNRPVWVFKHLELLGLPTSYPRSSLKLQVNNDGRCNTERTSVRNVTMVSYALHSSRQQPISRNQPIAEKSVFKNSLSPDLQEQLRLHCLSRENQRIRSNKVAAYFKSSLSETRTDKVEFLAQNAVPNVTLVPMKRLCERMICKSRFLVKIISACMPLIMCPSYFKISRAANEIMGSSGIK
ncbi:hypothetical protein CHS0354_028505 [Potamilus streckersoni]|uniref:Uncharacterized protein n=1 Tax=Potamilus streckersoni TaxID=2493646 RepID=A0AAE0SFI4_9BIVA|nr:hypothetical protein CHS0354_028505 [Potamilus streckersoni]